MATLQTKTFVQSISATKNSRKQERKKVSNSQKQKREEDKRQNKRKKETRDQMSEKMKNVEWGWCVRDDCTDFIEFFFISILSCIWKQTVFFHRPLTNTLRDYIADRSKILTFRSIF